MNRSQFVQSLVLGSICDDFENVDQVILRIIAEDGAKSGLTIERPEVVIALTCLVEAGLARAYELSSFGGRDPFSGILSGMPQIDEVEEDFHTYFYVTEKGLEQHRADRAWWPFDDLGNPRPDWSLEID
ncbi:MAG: hypothetical protein ABI811_16260 [Acidobacteriota bacterium]